MQHSSRSLSPIWYDRLTFASAEVVKYSEHCVSVVHHWWIKSQNADIKRVQFLWGAIAVVFSLPDWHATEMLKTYCSFCTETFPEHWHGILPLWICCLEYHTSLNVDHVYWGYADPQSSFAFNSYNKDHPYRAHDDWICLVTWHKSDHHPSHYFLPLVACTGLFLSPNSTCIPNPTHQKIFIGLGTVGTLAYLWSGVV